MPGEDGKNDPKKSLPPDPSAAAQVGQDLLAQLHNDFVVHKQPLPVGDANKGAQLGQDLLAQFAHDFGAKKRAEDAASLQAFGQQLLGAVARDFGSVRPSAPPTGPHPAVVIPSAAPLPNGLANGLANGLGAASSTSTSSSPGSLPAPALAAPPNYVPPPAKVHTLAPPPSAELVKAEEELAKIEAMPLAKDEEAELEAMQGRGALGFLRRFLKR
jgi:hypothetical protein